MRDLGAQEKERKNMLAVIPARGGSKGVPGKNIKELAGRPLLAYTVEAALESGIFSKVIVSTDSEEIADIAIRCGAEVPFLRPAEISGDMTSSDDVILHALSYCRENCISSETVCKLQPTSPLRSSSHIKDAYHLFTQRCADFLVSVCECEHSPLWMGSIGEDLCMDDFIPEEVRRSCRQELPSYYRLNGAIYMARTDKYKENKSFFGKNSIAYIMNQEESVDIDSYLDFRIAEIIMEEERGRIKKSADFAGK